MKSPLPWPQAVTEAVRRERERRKEVARMNAVSDELRGADRKAGEAEGYERGMFHGVLLSIVLILAVLAIAWWVRYA